MRIDRDKYQGGHNVALFRLDYCLTQLENATKFSNNLDWDNDIVMNCTIEEIIGALVCAEQNVKREWGIKK